MLADIEHLPGRKTRRTIMGARRRLILSLCMSLGVSRDTRNLKRDSLKHLLQADQLLAACRMLQSPGTESGTWRKSKQLVMLLRVACARKQSGNDRSSCVSVGVGTGSLHLLKKKQITNWTQPITSCKQTSAKQKDLKPKWPFQASFKILPVYLVALLIHR